jgi:hypothetical protein
LFEIQGGGRDRLPVTKTLENASPAPRPAPPPPRQTDILCLAARRWPRLEHLSLHCCEGVTPRALAALAGAAGPALARLDLRCCLAVTEDEARAVVPGRVEVAYFFADWWSDGCG